MSVHEDIKPKTKSRIQKRALDHTEAEEIARKLKQRGFSVTISRDLCDPWIYRAPYTITGRKYR